MKVSWIIDEARRLAPELFGKGKAFIRYKVTNR